MHWLSFIWLLERTFLRWGAIGLCCLFYQSLGSPHAASDRAPVVWHHHHARSAIDEIDYWL
ncbi:hypothetical protein [Microcoleus anatoxicus]|uniref:Uncharacterized protein n=1 Tax=Microcoleus anatoxicus PTRS2 TaxID=2705321 RepID=A0ABU8YUN1_9CYAN